MRKFSVYFALFLFLFSAGCASSPPEKGVEVPAILKIYLVRHGQAYSNLPLASLMSKEKRDSLTPEGSQQAKETGDYLRGKNIVAVIASPTGRTRETARIIAEELGLKGVFTENASFASMKDGKTPDGKPSNIAWRVSQWSAGQDLRPEGGESLGDATKRAVEAVETFAASYRGKALVIVSHSDICAGLAGHADNTPVHQRYDKHSIGFASVIEIGILQQGTWRLLGKT